MKYPKGSIEGGWGAVGVGVGWGWVVSRVVVGRTEPQWPEEQYQKFNIHVVAVSEGKEGWEDRKKILRKND